MRHQFNSYVCICWYFKWRLLCPTFIDTVQKSKYTEMRTIIPVMLFTGCQGQTFALSFILWMLPFSRCTKTEKLMMPLGIDSRKLHKRLG